MTITQRLSLAFSLLSATIIAIVIMAILVVNGFQGRFQYVQNNSIPSIIDTGKLSDRANRLILLMYRHQSATSVARQEPVEKDIAEEIEALKTVTQHYLDNYITNDDDRKLTEDGLAIIQRIQTQLPVFIEGSRAQNDAIALGQLQSATGVGASARDLVSTYQKQLTLNVEVSQALAEQNNHIYQRVFWGMLGGSMLVVLILGAFTIRTILSIRRSLHAMRDTMERASERLDLTLQVDDSKNDEIGMTGKAYNALLGNVASSLSSVRLSAQSVSTASTQISAGNENLSARTEEQAASLEQTASSMSELSETVRQTAENTKMASQLAKGARDISADSLQKVDTMLGTMSDIRNSSAKITDIISIIEGIAFQTNILALNAAVEAARAGEQGRGFAVVAGEVRNLAQRSSASAREIKELIESSIRFVNTGADQAEDVAKNMDKMRDSISQSSDLVDEISTAAQEQMLGIDQIHQAVNQMDDVTQQNASLVEQASAASASLMEQANILNDLVGAFVIVSGSETKIAPSVTHQPAKTALPLIKKPAAGNNNNDDNWQSF